MLVCMSPSYSIPRADRLRSRLIIGLTALIVALVLAMAWQANRSIPSHNQTAVAVLQDYARLAADEFGRRAMAATGYYGYYSVMNELRAAAKNGEDPVVLPMAQGGDEG